MHNLSTSKKLYVLTAAEMIERFSFYGAQAVLVLFLINVFHFSKMESLTYFGVFTTFAYSLPICGGFIADKYFDHYKTVLLGGFLLVTGNILLAMPEHKIFFLGLVLIATGTGLYKGNIAALIGELYQSDSSNCGSGFTIFYMGTNIGAALGAIIYGVFAETHHWHYAFLLSAFLLIFSQLLLFVIKSSLYQGLTKKIIAKSHGVIVACTILSLIIIVALIMQFPSFLPKLIIIFAVILISYFIIMLNKLDKVQNFNILLIIVFCLFATIFFSASLQVSSIINLFIDYCVNRKVMGFTIPTLFFTSLYPIAVIVASPFLSILWSHLAKNKIDISTDKKITLGLLCGSCAFLFFYLSGIALTHNTIRLFDIVIGNLFLGIGELLIFPPLLTMIATTINPLIQGQMMGVTYLFVAFAGYLSAVIAKKAEVYIQMTDTHNLNMLSQAYSHVFLFFCLGLLLITFFAYVLSAFKRKVFIK